MPATCTRSGDESHHRRRGNWKEIVVLDIVSSGSSTYLQASLKPKHKVASICTRWAVAVYASIVRDSSGESSTLAAADTSAPFSSSPSSDAETSLRALVLSSLVAVSPCWECVWDCDWSACTPAGRKGGPSSSLSSWKRKVSQSSMSCDSVLAMEQHF
jgi:hypothetical protein